LKSFLFGLSIVLNAFAFSTHGEGYKHDLLMTRTEP